MALRCVFFVALYCLAATAAAADLDAFPIAVDGKVRQVIWLPKVANADRFKVQLVPGRVELVDCNPRSYLATIERKTVDGWGYPYYVLSESTSGPATVKACAPGHKTTRRFVRVHGEDLTLPYQSRLPLVVYVPEDMTLKYRVWRADKSLSRARAQ